jgi:hypothetical protein
MINHLDSATRKALDAARRADFRDSIQIGDVFVNSWGYEQTNVDFYLVVGKIGKATLLIKKMTNIHEQREGYSSMSSHVVPGEAVGKPLRVRVGNQSINLGRGYYATKWDGKPEYCSWYA